MWWAYLIPAALACGVVTGAIAYHKGYSFSWWMLNGTVFFVIGLGYAIIMAPNQRELEKRKVGTGLFKKCPYCAKAIDLEATECQYCGRNVAVLEKH